MKADKLYTIREIAEEIGVSRQAVHKKIKQEPLSTSLQEFTSMTDNTIYVSVDGATLIKSAFNRDEPSTVDDNRPRVDVNLAAELTTKLIDSLQAQIDYLTEQIKNKDELLKMKDKKNDELTDTITELTDRLATLFENSQQLQQNQQLLEAKHQEEQPRDEPKKQKWNPFKKRNS